MSKQSRVVATHRINAEELFQVTVELSMPHPGAVTLDEAEAVAVRGVKQMRADAVEQGFLVVEDDTAD